MNKYADLEIGLHRREADSYSVEFRFRHPNSEADVRFGLDQPAQITFDLGELNKLAYDLKAYSHKLTEYFFTEPSFKTAFAQARASAQSLGVPLRLQLMIGHSAPELHGLRWEMLRDPQDGCPLATSENLLFSRYLSSQDWRPVQLRSKEALDALILVANPSDLEFYNLAPVDVMSETSRARQGLGEISMRALPDPASDQRATLSNLVNHLRENNPAILYLVCHGAQLKEDSWLWLEDEQGMVARASGADLVTRLQELEQRPQLVVLASCESAGDGSNPALAALGPRLAEAGVPAVLAMQGQISMETMAEFMPVFFRELQRDGQIDRALSVARGAVRQQPDWWMPVLFSRLRDNLLFPSESAESTTTGPTINISGNITGDVNVELSGEVKINAADLPIPPPPEPEQPPSTEGFLGREGELAKFDDQLRSAHLAVICGIAGMGKTMLAAELARRAARPENIFWHRFRQGEGVESIVWQLAGFLAGRGQDDLWQLLQRTRMTHGNLPPAETLLDYLFQMLRGRDYLVCLDDIHIVDDDPQLNQFVERARQLIFAGELSVIITSRKLPDYVTSVEKAFIPGLSFETTKQLLLHREVQLADELIIKLHEKTHGNAELVTLSIELLRKSSKPEQLLRNLSETADVERYLLSEIDAHLSDLEPEVMSAVSLLSLFGQMGTRYSIAAVLEGESVRRVLRDLSDRFLLIVQDAEAGQEYGQHAMVREFYYDVLNRRQREAMHRLAGAYYLEEEPDLLRAAVHFERAKEVEKAVQLVAGDVWKYINQGQSRALQELLGRFKQRDLNAADWLQVKLAQGEVYAFLGEAEGARACYQEVISQLAAHPDGDSLRVEKVRATRGLGELLEQEAPQEALRWFQEGLDEVAGTGTFEEAGLHEVIGSLHMTLGNYSQAVEALEKSLALLLDDPSQLRATVLANLGVIAVEQGADLEKGIALAQQSLEISRFLHDHFKAAEVLSTLGSYKMNSGDWPAAMDDFRQALTLTEQLGSEKALASAHINLGTACIDQGRYEEAQQHLEKGAGLAQATHQPFYACIALLSLAELKFRQGEAEGAAGFLTEAEALNAQFGDKINTMIILRGWAQVKLAAGEIDLALEDAQRAVDLAGEVGEAIEQGINLRILGQVYGALDRCQEALDLFQQSEALLAEEYPYEAARTLLQWGAALFADGNSEKGHSLLGKARATFQTLGAQQELAAIEVWSEGPNDLKDHPSPPAL